MKITDIAAALKDQFEKELVFFNSAMAYRGDSLTGSFFINLPQSRKDAEEEMNYRFVQHANLVMGYSILSLHFNALESCGDAEAIKGIANLKKYPHLPYSDHIDAILRLTGSDMYMERLITSILMHEALQSKFKFFPYSIPPLELEAIAEQINVKSFAIKTSVEPSKDFYYFNAEIIHSTLMALSFVLDNSVEALNITVQEVSKLHPLNNPEIKVGEVTVRANQRGGIKFTLTAAAAKKVEVAIKAQLMNYKPLSLFNIA